MLLWNALSFLSLLSLSLCANEQSIALSSCPLDSDKAKSMSKVKKLFNRVLNLPSLKSILMMKENSWALQSNIGPSLVQEQGFCVQYEPKIDHSLPIRPKKVGFITPDSKTFILKKPKPYNVESSTLEYALPFARHLILFQRAFDTGKKFGFKSRRGLPSDTELHADYPMRPENLDQIIEALTRKFLQIIDSVEDESKNLMKCFEFFVVAIGRYPQFDLVLDYFSAKNIFKAQELQNSVTRMVYFLSGDNFIKAMNACGEEAHKLTFDLERMIISGVSERTLLFIVDYFHFDNTFKSIYDLLLLSDREGSESSGLRQACLSRCETFEDVPYCKSFDFKFIKLNNDLKHFLAELGFPAPKAFAFSYQNYQSTRISLMGPSNIPAKKSTFQKRVVEPVSRLSMRAKSMDFRLKKSSPP